MTNLNYASGVNFAEDLINNNDAEMLSVFLDSMLPLMSKSDRDKIVSGLKSKALVKGGEVAKTFVDRMGMNDKDAFVYLKAQISNGDQKDILIDTAIAAGGSNYGAVVVLALLSNKMIIANKMIKQHGVQRITVRRFGSSSLSINGVAGVVIDIPQSSGHITTNELLVMISIARDCGIIGQINDIDHPKFIFSPEHLKNYDNPVPSEGWSRLPEFNNGVVYKPEMALTFLDKHESSASPDLYSRIPVVIAADEALSFPGASIFTAQLGVWVSKPDSPHNFDLGRKSERMSIDEFNTMISYSHDKAYPLVAVQMGLRCTSHLKKERHAFDKKLLLAMLGNEWLCGAALEKGKVIAVIDTVDIKTLEVDRIDDDELIKSNDFTSQFIPSSLASHVYGGFEIESASNDVECVDLSRNNITSLIDILAINPGVEIAISQYLGAPLCNELVKQATTLNLSRDLSARALIYLQNQWGMTPKWTITLTDYAFIEALWRGNYNLSNCHVSVSSSDYPLDVAIMLCDLGVWPSSFHSKPRGVYEALVQSVKMPGLVAGEAYLRSEGIEAVVRVAKTEPQWNRVRQIFSEPDEVSFLLEHGPSRVRRSILSDCLGL